ncbi:MAG: Holliday junction branch migration protein RuvA [Betaproteobacteria bacterium TMED82]|nr:MAG: Holliday junction branch migration protein RuvA [Betaproteobacteria bacterium TMED82]|tara:strand:+ start:24560 stop:25129 length:570 start_codon:yes stop_codon:yes gene_type:complete
MINHLIGIITEKSLPSVIVDVKGVGYQVDVPMSTYSELPEKGEKVKLITHFIVREDSHQLFGFLTKEEREVFKEIIKIAGIGPRVGLGILSSYSVSEFISDIESDNHDALVRIPGIGKKTSERLTLELRGKLPKVAVTKPENDGKTDLLNALIALGFSEKEANLKSKNASNEVSLQENIKEALKDHRNN